MTRSHRTSCSVAVAAVWGLRAAGRLDSRCLLRARNAKGRDMSEKLLASSLREWAGLISSSRRDERKLLTDSAELIERLQAALQQIVTEYEPSYAAWDFVGIAKQALRHHFWSDAVASGAVRHCVICGVTTAIPAPLGVIGECAGRGAT